MSGAPFVNLYVYSDSLAFRRLGQARDLSFTYPFVLKELVETRLGIRANLMLRGGGGATVTHIREVLVSDSGYSGGDNSTINIAIIQCGIVDCAPRPITYLAAPLLRRVPIVGMHILAALTSHRSGIQRMWSYTVTSKRRFAKEYARIIATCHNSFIRPIAVGLPLPTLTIERRSPGFRRSASIYNGLIRDALPGSFCDIEQQMTESSRATVLLDDGHHLTEAGHRLYAEALFVHLQKNL
jgi:hypothetical protein